MDDKFKIPMNEKKFIENLNKKLSKTMLRTALSVTLAIAMLAPMGVFAKNQLGGGILLNSSLAILLNQNASQNTIDKINFPEYAGALIRDFHVPNSGAGAIRKEKVKELVLENDQVKELLENNSIDAKDVTVEVGNELREATDAVARGDFKRTPQLKDVSVKLKVDNKESKPIKVKVFYYRPPFNFPNGSGEFKESSSLNAIGKLVVDDPNNYTLTADQMTIAKERFLAANKDLGIQENDITIDNQGEATITLNGTTMKVPSSEFVSPIGRVPDFWVFKDTNSNPPKALEIGYNDGRAIEVPVKKGVELNNVKHIKNPLSYLQEQKGLAITYDKENSKIKITGAVTEGGGRFKSIGARFLIQANDTGLNRALSNVIRVHCIYTDESTLIRNVDENSEHVDAKGDELIKSLNPHTKGIAWSGDNSFGPIEGYNYDKPETAGDINNAIKESKLTTKINVQNLQHQVGYQEFDVNMTTPQGQKSSPMKAKLIYYTKKIPVTVVGNQTNLTKEEKDSIIDKVKNANCYDKTNNPFEVEVGNDGRITLKYKVDNGNLLDKNGAKKKEVTIDLGRPVQEFRFKDSEVKPGGNVEVDKPAKVGADNKIEKGTDGQPVLVPDGTTYEGPDGSTTNNDGSFTVSVAHDNSSVDVKVTPQKNGTLKFEVPDNAPTNTTIDVPVKVKVPNAGYTIITAKVHILSPDKDLYKPSADKVEKNFGEAPKNEEVFAKISLSKEDSLPTDVPIPNATNDKIKSYALKENVTLPDGQTSGKFDVAVVVTYKDGSSEEVTVPVIIGPKAPKVDAKDNGSVEITPDDPNATEMTVKYTPEGEGATETTLTVTKGTDGNWSLPQGTEGITVDASTGKVTIPEDKVKDKSDVYASNKANIDGKDYPSDDTKGEAKAPKPGYANIKYVLQTGFNSSPKVITQIDNKFKPDTATETTHPTRLEGKNGRAITLDDFNVGNKNENAPKFIGYTFKTKGSNGPLGNYNTDLTKAGTIYLTYDKLDEIQEGGEGKTCPDGYVVVTFKDVDGAKVGGEDKGKVYYVNPKAGVKLEKDTDGKYKLVGKNANNVEVKIEIPEVTADSTHTLEDDHWTPGTNGIVVGSEITKPTEYTPNVTAKVVKVKLPAPTAATKDGAVTVTPPTGTDADKVNKIEIKYTPEGDNATEKTVELTKGTDGKWKLPDGTTDITVDDSGVVTIPADKVKDNSEVTAKAKGDDATTIPSDDATITAGSNPAPVKPDDTKQEGKDIVVKVGQNPDPIDGIKNPDKLPKGSSLEFESPIDTSVVGEKDAVIVVRDSDGKVIQKINIKVKVIEDVIIPDEEDIIRFFPQHDYTPTYKVKAVMPNDMTVNKAEEVKANVKENIYIEKHYMNGISSEKFAPEKSLTRAEAAQILSNALKSDGYEKTADVKYNDLKANAWYMEAIKRVTAAGVFEGYEDGSFKPDKKITRAEWISTLVRFQKLEKAEGNSLNLEKHWALGDVEAALKAGWLDIYSKGIAKPLLDGEMPRCEVAAVTNKAFNKLVDKKYLKDNVEKLVHFADVKEDSPYYEEILAAANDLYRESEEIKDKNYIGHELNGPVNIELANKNVKQIKFQREAR